MYDAAKNNYSVVLERHPRKANTRILLAVLLLGPMLFSVIAAWLGISSSVLLLTGILALPLAYTVVAHPRTGICILLVLAYIIMFFSRLTATFPIGTIMDGMELLLVFGLLLKKKYDKNRSLLNNSISVALLCWIGYNFLQVLNPWATSRLAWLYTIRTVALVAVTYFIFLYHINDIRFVRLLLKIWLALSLLAALYTFKQEFWGFSAFEKTWLQSDPSYERLYYIGNHWRKFSIFSDPVALAYNMAISCILCCCLATGPFSLSRKILLLLLAAIFFAAMLYSGTRGAFILLPAAFLLFAVLKFSRKILLAGLVLMILAAGVLMIPTSNPTLYRFQTAFKPANDASFNVRKYNQQRIRPYILSHPIGGGSGATGVWGKRFSPGSYLASFPPDSGYVRVAVELGWMGLLLFCTLIFVILRQGIRTYFRLKDPELKTYCLAMVLIVFTLNLGNYPQEALVQYPINIYFYLTVALIPVLRRLAHQPAELSGHTSPKKNLYGA